VTEPWLRQAMAGRPGRRDTGRVTGRPGGHVSVSNSSARLRVRAACARVPRPTTGVLRRPHALTDLARMARPGPIRCQCRRRDLIIVTGLSGRRARS
jgi:hypothetical protein